MSGATCVNGVNGVSGVTGVSGTTDVVMEILDAANGIDYVVSNLISMSVPLTCNKWIEVELKCLKLEKRINALIVRSQWYRGSFIRDPEAEILSLSKRDDELLLKFWWRTHCKLELIQALRKKNSIVES